MTLVWRRRRCGTLMDRPDATEADSQGALALTDPTAALMIDRDLHGS